MPEISATDAARNFADLLDAVEHRGETYTIVRRGKAIAQIEPTSSGRGDEVKSILRRFHPDHSWRSDLESVDVLLRLERRS